MSGTYVGEDSGLLPAQLCWVSSAFPLLPSSPIPPSLPPSLPLTQTSSIADDLNPLRVQFLFERIPDEDCDLLDMVGRPEHLVVTHLAVPPVAIRPRWIQGWLREEGGGWRVEGGRWRVEGPFLYTLFHKRNTPPSLLTSSASSHSLLLPSDRSVDMDGASNEDDITMKLMQIVETNNVLRQSLERGLPVNNLMENWDFLQVRSTLSVRRCT